MINLFRTGALPASFPIAVCRSVCLLAVVFFGLNVVTDYALVAQDGKPQKNADPKNQQTASVTTHGVGRYQPERWGTIGINAVNGGGDATSIEAAAWIGSNKAAQFGRSVWVPAEARRTSWAPVFVSKQGAGAGDSTLNSMTVKTLDGREVFSTARNYDRVETRQLIAPRGNVVFAVITDHNDQDLSKNDLLKYLMSRVQQDATVVSIPNDQLPMIPEALDIVRVLVVIGDTLALDSAATEAVQDWVHQGGTLWLMLDTMSSESAHTICGDELMVDEIDRVSLTSYSLLTVRNSLRRTADQVELERPVELVRVFCESDNTLSTVDDWPAIVQFPSGQGRIFGSTLSLDGLFVPANRLSPERAREIGQPLWTTTAGQDFISALGSSGTGAPLQTDSMKDYVTSRVGYQLPDRSTGASVLAVFCVALTVGCGVVHRLQKPFLLLPSVGVLAVLTTFAFLQMTGSSQTISNSSVALQVAEASGALDRLQVSGLTAFHTKGSSQPVIRSSSGGILEFDHSIDSGSPVRMLWSDQNAWNLQNVKFSAGVRLAEFRQTVDLLEPAVVRGTFDETGFRGQLSGSVSTTWSDAIVADQSGFALPVSINRDGQFAGESKSLPPGQHLDAALLNAEQSRRQTVYRSVFDASQRSRVYPSAPTLLAWTDPLKLQTGQADSDNTAGAMLATFPIIIERPDAGSRVRVPATFLPYRSVENKKLKVGVAPTFSNTRRTWSTNTYSSASKTILRFELPSELLPLQVDKATLTLNFSAPLRDVAIRSGDLESLSDVWSKKSPVGTFEIPFSDKTSMQLDQSGGFNILLEIGAVQLDKLDAAEVGTQDRNWDIEWMQLEIEGLIQ